jgi:hypothetical protein
VIEHYCSRSNDYLDVGRCDKESNALDIALLFLSRPPSLGLLLVGIDVVIAYNLATPSNASIYNRSLQ